MALSLLAVHNAATSLLECVCQGLARIPTEVPGLAGCPCRTCVVPGTPAADNCGDGCGTLPAGQYPGQLTVNVVRIYQTARADFPRYSPSQPSSVLDARGCTGMPTTAVDLLVTLYRCAPGPGKDGCPPSCDDLNDSAMQLHTDMLVMQSSIQCCYGGTDTTRRTGRRFTIGQAAVTGPRGLCVGIEQQVTVALDDGVAPPPAVP